MNHEHALANDYLERSSSLDSWRTMPRKRRAVKLRRHPQRKVSSSRAVGSADYGLLVLVVLPLAKSCCISASHYVHISQFPALGYRSPYEWRKFNWPRESQARIYPD